MKENPFQHIPLRETEDRPIVTDLAFDSFGTPDKQLEVQESHVRVLTEQLETGSTSHFDAELVSLLQEISESKEKSRIASTLVNTGLVTLRSVGSKIAGIFGALEAGIQTKQYVAREASEYLSEHMYLTSDSVKSLPSKAATSITETAQEAEKHMHPDVAGGFRDLFGAIKDTVKDITGATKDTIEGAGGKEMLDATKEAIVSGTGKGVDSTVDGVNQLLHPAIDAASETAGWTSYLPAAAIGYMLASGIVGGIAGVLKERKDRNSFDHVKPLIDRVWTFNKENVENSEQDPRIELVVVFNQMKNEPNKSKYSLTKEEWLLLATATREARCSLLREKTKAPEITLGIEKKSLETKSDIVERIISNTQYSLAEEDMNLAREILVQYDNRLTQDMQPLEKQNALENKMSRKIVRYSKTFVQSGLKSTGLPTLWKGVKIPLKLGRRLLPF